MSARVFTRHHLASLSKIIKSKQHLIALVIANVINCVIILWQLKKFTNLSFQIDWQIWRAICLYLASSTHHCF